MNIRLVWFLLASAVAGFAAEAVPLFNATLSMGREQRFVLVSTAGKTSGWLKIGEAFEGYVIKAYDAKAAALDLERDGKITRVTLVGDAAIDSAPAVPTPATLADATALMNKIHVDELLERSIAQQRKMVAGSVERMGTNFPGVEKADLAAFQKKVMAEVDASLDVSQMKGELTRIYSETFSKEELDGISAFYDTPLGQVLLTKQPEVQQKMQAAMIPRMAQLGPKIQQMAKDFAAEQKAKQTGGATAPVPAPAPKQ